MDINKVFSYKIPRQTTTTTTTQNANPFDKEISSTFKNETEDEPEDEYDIQTSNKSVFRMSNRSEEIEKDPRVQRFMGQYIDTKRDNKQQSNVRFANQFSQPASGKSKGMPFQPAAGRMTATGIQVDDINRKFRGGDPEHLMKLKPPATSTPTTEELAEAWGVIEQQENAEDELYSDTLVQFIMLVDGFSDSNSITTVTNSGSIQGMPLSNIYNTLAADRVNKFTGTPNRFTPPLIRGFSIGTGNAGLPNVAGQRHVTTMRAGSSIDDDITQTIKKRDIERRMSMLGTPYGATPGLSPIRRRSSFYPSTGGAPYYSPERRVLFADAKRTPFSVHDFDPSGPKSQGGPAPPQGGIPPGGGDPVPPNNPLGGDTNIQDLVQGEYGTGGDNPLDTVPIGGVPPVPSVAPVGTRATAGTALVGYADDPKNAEAIAKYLSDLRTINAYNFIGRPEVTGRIRIQNATMAAIRIAYKSLMIKFHSQYNGATLEDFITDPELMEHFAYYVSLWKLYNVSKGMNKVTLERAQPRLLSDKIAMERGVFSLYTFDNYTKKFVSKSHGISYRNNYNRERPYENIIAIQNEMFNY